MKFSPDVALWVVYSCAKFRYNISSRFDSILAAQFTIGWRLYSIRPAHVQNLPWTISDEPIEISTPNLARVLSVWVHTISESFTLLPCLVQISHSGCSEKCPDLHSADTRLGRPTVTIPTPDPPRQVVHRSTRASSLNTPVQTACLYSTA
jgi:hypothetical protein